MQEIQLRGGFLEGVGSMVVGRPLHAVAWYRSTTHTARKRGRRWDKELPRDVEGEDLEFFLLGA